jgi:hypothetical protein
MKYEICDDVIDSTMANSYVMYEAHMTHLGKSTKVMSHFVQYDFSEGFHQVMHSFNFKNHSDGSSFCTQSHEVTLFHVVD